MPPYNFILYILTLVIVLIVLIFSILNRKDKKTHDVRMKELSNAIHVHQQQIKLRGFHLQAYDFLKYNLREALHVQLNIQV